MSLRAKAMGWILACLWRELHPEASRVKGGKCPSLGEGRNAGSAGERRHSRAFAHPRALGTMAKARNCLCSPGWWDGDPLGIGASPSSLAQDAFLRLPALPGADFRHWMAFLGASRTARTALNPRIPELSSCCPCPQQLGWAGLSLAAGRVQSWGFAHVWKDTKLWQLGRTV